jgi:hypothetical protein
MDLSDEQATRLRMVNELITNDPQAARTLAGRWGEMIREETEARAAANARRDPQETLDDVVQPGGAGLTAQEKPRRAERASLQESLTERTARILAGQAAQFERDAAAAKQLRLRDEAQADARDRDFEVQGEAEAEAGE